MNSDDNALGIIQEIVKNQLQVNAIIQDIEQCTGPLELLNDLNNDGRNKLNSLRNSIDKLYKLGEIELNVSKKCELMVEVENRKSQLSFALTAFRKANIVAACVINKMAKDELLLTPEEQQRVLRKRKNKNDFVNSAGKATQKLLSISRTLAETNQRSADTLDTLLTSSDKVNGTRNELEYQQQAIVQSGQLLGKYGRREVTDKALLLLAFVFFLICVFYVLQKRLW